MVDKKSVVHPKGVGGSLRRGDMDICLDEELRTIEVNLTDRSHFDYPLLIGASAIRKLGAAIDPGSRYTAQQPQC